MGSQPVRKGFTRRPVEEKKEESSTPSGLPPGISRDFAARAVIDPKKPIESKRSERRVRPEDSNWQGTKGS